MANPRRIVLELRAGPVSEEELVVTRVVGREALSTPFAFDVELVPASGDPLDVADLTGAEALLTLREEPGGAERHVHGILWSVEMAGVASGRPRYRARLVPALDRLGAVVRTRAFQGRSAPEIAARILGDAGVAHRLALAASYPARELCVQYRESDLAFVARLLEEEGIFYFFEHEPDAHVMVLADEVSACGPMAGGTSVPYREPGSHGIAEEHLSRVEHVRRAAPATASVQDFDFTRPALDVVGERTAAGDPLGLEHHEYPGRFTDPAAGARRAAVRLEGLRAASETFTGAGTCFRLVPGASFDLVDHPDAAFQRKLLVLRVEHDAARQDGSAGAAVPPHGYRSTFGAIDAAAPWRPRRRTRRPVARAETAVVVGPHAEEIHPDEHGRIKVRFHWDREGARDDTASCWIRCAQAWAGPGWGASFVPRVGQEVLVQFLDGDPDRPLVTGAVYNGQNPPPVELPGEKTRSTLRTDSSPGSWGSNELRFEDAKDAEQVYLHAQKDERIEVRNDEAQEVGADETLAVKKDRALEAHGNQALSVTGADSSGVGGAQTLTVAGKRETAVAGGHTERVGVQQAVTVAGHRDVTVRLGAVETVAAAAALNVGGGYAVNVAGVFNKAVAGLFSGQVGGARVEVVGGAREERVAGSSEAKIAGDLEIEVGGRVALSTLGDQKDDVGGAHEVEVAEPVSWDAKELLLEADKLSIVVGGDVALSLDQSGNVAIAAGTLTLEGTTLTLKGSKVDRSAAGSAASAAPEVTQLQPQPGERAWVEVTLNDQDGKPVPNEWFRVEFPDGTVKEGRTDAKGHAWVPGPKEGNAKVSFPGLVKQ